MRLLRLTEVHCGPRDRVFRYSPARALSLALAVLGASAALVLVARRGSSNLAYYFAVVSPLCLLLMRRFILARFRPSNWLVRMNDDGLFVQFRSYLNYHLPAEDLTVVFIPNREIRSARLVRERVTVPDEQHSSSERCQRLIELELGADPAELAKALAEECARRASAEPRWYGSTSTLYQHYPVRMAPPCAVQIEWNVVPGPQTFLDGLPRFVAIAPPVTLSQDFTHLEVLSREEQEDRLRALVRAGRKIDAIYVARRLYGNDLDRATAFVEGLTAAAGTGRP